MSSFITCSSGHFVGPDEPNCSPESGIECSICYTLIGKTNNCVTECGHEYCLSCMLLSARTKNTCPYCRFELVPKEEKEEEEESEEDISTIDEEEDDVAEDERLTWEMNHEATVEEIVDRFERSGITMLDVVSLMMHRYSRTDVKYTKDYIKKLNDTSHEIVFAADRERMAITGMSRNDFTA